MALTHKQLQFIDFYLGISNGNATDAARRAGYEGNDNVLGVTGNDNLRNPKITEEISRRYKERCMGSEEVLTRLAAQARGPGAYMRALDGERAYVDIDSLLKDGNGHLIKGVKYTDKGQCIVEFHDSQAALVHIGRHHKLFTDKTEHSGEIGVRNLGDLTDDDIDQLLSEGTQGRTSTPPLEG